MTGSSFPPAYWLALGFVCGLAGFRLGWRFGNRFLLPLVQAIFGWVAFAAAWRAHGPAWSAGVVLLWAAGTTVASVGEFAGRPVETDRRVLRAAPYRGEMLRWLRTGMGPESSPGATAGRHLAELLVYLAAAVASANFLGIALGAILLNYMNAYVAALLRAARRRAVVLALAWNVWSVVRVTAYVALGAAATVPLGPWVGLPRPADAGASLLVVGGVGVALDLVLKLALSRPCGRALAGAVDLDAAAKGGRAAPPTFTLGL